MGRQAAGCPFKGCKYVFGTLDLNYPSVGCLHWLSAGCLQGRTVISSERVAHNKPWLLNVDVSLGWVLVWTSVDPGEDHSSLKAR